MTLRRRRATLLALLASLLGLSSQAAIAQHPDFNGDGFADLAVGAPGEGVTLRAMPPVAVNDAGAVNVLYGSAVGLTAQIDQLWSQAPTNVLDVPEKGDDFGASLAWGDFDGDGFDDLAVGVPNEGLGAERTLREPERLLRVGLGSGRRRQPVLDARQPGRAGRRRIRATCSARAWRPATSTATASTTLSWADERKTSGPVVDGAGRGDRAPGSAGGLTSAGSQLWTQDSPGIPDTAEQFDGFGFSVTSGDFDGDGFDDLAIGALGEDLEAHGHGDERQAWCMCSTVRMPGLVSAGNQIWSQNSPGVPETAEQDDDFGRRWPRAISTATDSTTWPWAFRRRTGTTFSRTRAPCRSSTARVGPHCARDPALHAGVGRDPGHEEPDDVFGFRSPPAT